MLSEIFSLFGSVESLREKASSGDVEAQYRMGRMYEDGRRVARNEETAAQWYNRAADRGHGAAQYRLGLMYASGRGVSRDSARALRWLRLAAEQNVAGARPLLEQVEIEAAAEAEAGWRGRSRAARPESEARRAGRRAAREAPPLPISRAKIVFAIIAIVFLINVGMAFFAIDRYNRANRQSPPPQPAPTARPGPSAAAAHYLAQAEKGDVNAMFRVARMYDRGSDGMPQVDERAVFWYRQGAARGHALSLYCLGWMHEQGRGVPKDMEEALKWYRKAEAAGYKGATDRLEELERRRELEMLRQEL